MARAEQGNAALVTGNPRKAPGARADGDCGAGPGVVLLGVQDEVCAGRLLTGRRSVREPLHSGTATHQDTRLMARKRDNSPRDYEVGYGQPPKDSQFPKGVSGNRAGRPKSKTGPALGHLVQDAVLKVMGERVTFEVSPGRRQSMPRAEALVRELYDRAVYDHRSAKLLFEMFGRARYQQEELQKKQARAEEARLQNERDKELWRERALQRAEEEALEQRRQKNLRRRERAAERRAAQAAAEAARLLREAAEADAADQGAPASLLERELSVEYPPQDADDVPEPVEDARLYGEAYRQSLAAARKPKARPVTPPAQAHQAEGAPVPSVISVAPRTVRRSASVRRPSGPLIESSQPLIGHSLGLSGTSKPPPFKIN